MLRDLQAMVRERRARNRVQEGSSGASARGCYPALIFIYIAKISQSDDLDEK